MVGVIEMVLCYFNSNKKASEHSPKKKKKIFQVQNVQMVGKFAQSPVAARIAWIYNLLSIVNFTI